MRLTYINVSIDVNTVRSCVDVRQASWGMRLGSLRGLLYDLLRIMVIVGFVGVFRTSGEVGRPRERSEKVCTAQRVKLVYVCELEPAEAVHCVAELPIASVGFRTA